MRTQSLLCLAATTWLVLGCASPTAYYTGQSWQKQQCFKIDDPQQRQRCLKSASTSYEDYQRETEALPSRP